MRLWIDTAALGTAGQAVQAKVGEMKARVNQQVLSRGTRAINQLRNAELEVLRGKGSGRTYRKYPYKSSGTCLKPGDILLNDNHHVAIAVSGDASSNATPAKKNYLEKGDTGSEVTAMQKMLIKVGYSCGAAGADGDFGSDTDSALRKFQKDNGLTVDGQYGTNSKAKLTALYNKKVGTTTSNKKDVTTVAKEVIAGKWGSGDERKKKLTAAGYNYDTVQKKVNELLKTRTKKSVAEVAKEVVSGKWGNGADRKKKLEAAGYNYAEVQKEVNKLLK